MIRRLRPFGLLLAVLALAAVPAVSQAERGKGKGKGKSEKCVIHPGYVVKGKLVGFTNGDDAVVTLKVTGANRHARLSGVDKGDEVTYSSATDPNGFKLKLSGYESGEDPEAGDKVRVVGKIEYTKRKCARDKPRRERYGDVNVRRVKLIDRDRTS